MKFPKFDTNSIALSISAFVVFAFFICGLFDVLNYIIVKVLIVIGFLALFIMATYFVLNNDSKKNRPETKAQDDSY